MIYGSSNSFCHKKCQDQENTKSTNETCRGVPEEHPSFLPDKDTASW